MAAAHSWVACERSRISKKKKRLRSQANSWAITHYLKHNLLVSSGANQRTVIVIDR